MDHSQNVQPEGCGAAFGALRISGELCTNPGWMLSGTLLSLLAYFGCNSDISTTCNIPLGRFAAATLAQRACDFSHRPLLAPRFRLKTGGSSWLT